MREGRGKYLLLVLILLRFATNAQQITVRSGFVEDSLLIGQNVNYWISASYPASLEMIFPDSSYSFLPFEYTDKTYFKTKLVNGIAFDSTIYTIQSFEIDPVQYLSLRAIILNDPDSTIINSPLDSIYLTELTSIVTDSTKLKTNLDYQAVDTQFNYPLMYYILWGTAFLIIILFLIFGKRIIRYFKLKKLERDYHNFSEAFIKYIRELQKNPEPELAEQALSIWKKYQQRLDKVRFITLTSKEILALGYTNELEKPLKSIDRAVYGGKIQEKIYQDFQQLENFTDDRFQKKVGEIKHG